MSTIVTRAGKGSPLTNTEMDSNLTNLNTDKWEASVVHAATGKTTPVDADEVPLIDSAASNVLKKLTWANLKATFIATANTWSGIQLFNDGKLTLAGSSSGTLTVKAPAAASTYVATFPAATATLGGLEVTQTWTKPQRGTVTTSNTITAIDLSTTNNHISTPAAGAALTFTNLTAGQAGTIEFVNGSNYAITAGSGTKVTSTFLATISVTGTYIISYYVNSAGTAVHCSTGGASA